ncbi:MAG TPA: spore coat U domain-containing protein [Kofleriaceae bacterium]|nr:spore coat U domain-containing protein [Kofleriaceae bacterium]
MITARTALLASFVVSALAAPARAGSASGDLTVSATVEDSCAITGGTLAFGAYDVAHGADVDASTAVTVACTAGASATITLDQGANPAAGSSDDAPLRRLSDGGTGFLSYTLYSDAARATVWGNSAGTGKAYTAATSDPIDQSVYGRITANQLVPLGVYTDHIVATIVF